MKFIFDFQFHIDLSQFPAGKKFGGPDKGQKPGGKFQNGKGKFQKPAPGKFTKPDGQTQQPAAPEKVDWTKFKQDKKDLRLKRKMTRTGFDKVNEAKQIYEKLKWYTSFI